jgi:hypothetical protein
MRSTDCRWIGHAFADADEVFVALCGGIDASPARIGFDAYYVDTSRPP